jgi:hypothetical protein
MQEEVQKTPNKVRKVNKPEKSIGTTNTNCTKRKQSRMVSKMEKESTEE